MAAKPSPASSNRLAVLALLLSALALSCCCIARFQPAHPERSYVEQAELSVWPLKTAHDATFCTAFSIDEAHGYWMTARHCAHGPIDNSGEEGEWEARLGVSWTNVVYRDPIMDLAVIQSPFKVKALEVAEAAAEVGDSVAIVGYPYGLVDGKTITYGHVGALLVPISPLYQPSDILDVRVAPGNSGSPVLNTAGRIVGLLWGRFPESGHSLVVPWAEVRRVVAQYHRATTMGPS